MEQVEKEKYFAIKARIEKNLEEMNDDENDEALEKAMHYFCSNWDIREGMKYAIKMTLDDQINNHLGENGIEEFNELSDILEGAI